MRRAIIIMGDILILSLGIWFFCSKLVKVVKWWRTGSPSMLSRFLTVLLPLIVTGLLLPGIILHFFHSLPVPQPELSTLTAPVRYVREYSHKHSSRSGVHFSYDYALKLEGYPDWIHLPDRMKVDQHDLLIWVGEQPITVRWAKAGNASIAYELQRDDGAYYLRYRRAASLLEQQAWDELAIGLALYLLPTGILLGLPAYLTTGSAQDRREKQVRACGMACFVLFMFFLASTSPNTSIQDTAAYTSTELPLGKGIWLTLPPGWEKEETKTATWYDIREKVSTEFVVKGSRYKVPVSDWEQHSVDEERAHILDSFITETWEDRDPFLTQLTDWRLADGRTLTICQGWGASEKSRNHFLMVPLEERDVLLILHSSSCGMSWEELEDYVDEHILPLLEGLTLTDPAVPQTA